MRCMSSRVEAARDEAGRIMPGSDAPLEYRSAAGSVRLMRCRMCRAQGVVEALGTVKPRTSRVLPHGNRAQCGRVA
jgi:hypothetical protein